MTTPIEVVIPEIPTQQELSGICMSVLRIPAQAFVVVQGRHRCLQQHWPFRYGKQA